MYEKSPCDMLFPLGLHQTKFISHTKQGGVCVTEDLSLPLYVCMSLVLGLIFPCPKKILLPSHLGLFSSSAALSNHLTD